MRQVFLILIVLFLITGCENNNKNNVNIDAVYKSAKADSIKLVHDTLLVDTCIGKAQYVLIIGGKNKLYTNVPNSIGITAINISADQFFLKTQPDIEMTISGTYKKGVSYMVTPKNPGLLNISIYKHEKNEDIYLGMCQYRVERLPDAIPRVGGYRNTVIDKNVLLNQQGIALANEECCWNINYEMVEFTVSTINEQGKVVENISTSNKFTEAQKDQIRKLKSGQKIYFENIKVIDMDGNTRNIGVIMLKIK